MASTHASLNAAATERKARLAKLKSLKRKQPTDSDDADPEHIPSIPASNESSLQLAPESTDRYLSGRNYDPSTRGPKLGFETAPSADSETLEDRAAAIALDTREQEEKERKEEKPIDLFSLQPKKPNWDLKRDVAKKMEVLNAKTDNAIARLVRERIEGQKRKELEKDREIGNSNGLGGGEVVGIGGIDLVQSVHVREQEEEEEERREKERDAEFA